MSGSTIGGIVGGIIGYVVGGPTGAQIGFALGSAVGGYVDPQKIEGPRLKDAAAQTSRDGVPIPFGYGTFPCAGNVIWQGELIETKKEERQGKGGPVNVTYVYTRSYAMGICEGEIVGLLLVKRNGKIIYDTRPDAELAALGFTTKQIQKLRLSSAKFLARTTIYTGSESQLADPTIEAVEGVGNVAAFRGLAYVVIENDDLTELSGAIPQYEFVVANDGGIVYGDCNPLLSGRFFAGNGSSELYYSDTGQVWGETRKATPGGTGDFGNVYSASGSIYVLAATNNKVSHDNGATWTALVGLPSGTPLGVCRAGTKTYITYSGLSNIYISTDGVNYSTVALGAAARSNPVVFMDLIVVGCSGGQISHSSDFGVAFTVYTISGGNNIQLLVDASQYLLAFRTMSDDVEVSADGLIGSWTPYPHALQGVSINAAAGGAYGNSAQGEQITVVVSQEGDTMISMNDGIDWELGDNVGFLLNSGSSQNIAWSETRDGELFVVAGQGGKIASSSTGLGWNLDFTQEDGTNFTGIASLPWQGSAEVIIPDLEGAFMLPDGQITTDCEGDIITTDTVLLSDIVADLFERIGLVSTQYDVSQLTDEVEGYRIATEGGVDSFIAPLMNAYFFDVAEWDGKIRCIKRGGSPSFTLTLDDMAYRDGDVIDQEIIQEAELLRKVTVGYLDRLTTFSPTTQKWERRIGTVEAKGEGSLELPIVCSADAAAQIAEKRGKVAWAEPSKFLFSLPYKWSRLTPTDIGTLELKDGNTVRVRLMLKDEDSGAILLEASADRAHAYIGTATGVSGPNPSTGATDVIGPTFLAAMNLPVIREQDDEVGVYIAGYGPLAGWRGAEVQVSTDGGANFVGIGTIATQSNIGLTRTDLSAWASSEYPAVQTLDVYMPFAIESISEEEILRYGNRAAVQLDSGEWEILQFETVVDNGDGEYSLSGLVRGRYSTTPGAISAGNQFVMLDSTVQFIQLERWMIGENLVYRAVSLGTDADNNSTGSLDYTTAVSQTEFKPHTLQGSRDSGTNDVTITWVGRGRLGVETAPFNSKYMTGYRVTYSDATTYDVGIDVTTHTRTSAPATQTITVAAINSITGLGPQSDGIIL